MAHRDIKALLANIDNVIKIQKAKKSYRPRIIHPIKVKEPIAEVTDPLSFSDIANAIDRVIERDRSGQDFLERFKHVCLILYDRKMFAEVRIILKEIFSLYGFGKNPPSRFETVYKKGARVKQFLMTPEMRNELMQNKSVARVVEEIFNE